MRGAGACGASRARARQASGAVGSEQTAYQLAALELSDNLLDDRVAKEIVALCKKNANVVALSLAGRRRAPA